MTEPRGPLHVWLEDEGGWAELASISRTALEEQHAYQPLPPELHVKVMTPPLPMPEWLRIDLGLPPAEPEPTPIERALDILRPHLAAVPLYQRTGPAARRLPLPSIPATREEPCPQPTPARSPTPKPAPCSHTSTGCR